MKEKTKTRKALTSEKLGGAYCYVAIERGSKFEALRMSCGNCYSGIFEYFSIFTETLSFQLAIVANDRGLSY